MSYSDGRQILREIAELEKKVKTTEVSIAKDIIQKKIRNSYRHIVVSYPELAHSKNVDNVLWKHCFYRQIEDTRKRIRGVTSILEKRTKGGEFMTPQELAKYQQMLLHLTASFQSFAAEVSAFYKSLLIELEGLLKRLLSSGTDLDPTDYTSHTSTSPPIVVAYTRSIHFCLLYLGDVARYSELHSDNDKEKNWKPARGYYLRARQVLPTVGNPYNQLAVLTSYGPSSGASAITTDLDAVYYYSRSILVQQPFQTGIDNLKVIFDKHAKNSHRDYSRAMVQTDRGGRRSGLGGSSGGALGAFIHQFVELQGALFYLSLKEITIGAVCRVTDAPAGVEPALTPHGNVSSNDEFQYSIASPPAQSIPPTSEAVTALNEYTSALVKTTAYVYDIMPTILDDLEKLVSNQQSGLTGAILIRVLGICLFAIHFSSIESERRHVVAVHHAADHESGLPSAKHTGCELAIRPVRSNAEALALIFLFNLINKLSLKICPLGSTERPRKGIVLRALQLFSVFSDWGRGNVPFLHGVSSSGVPAGLDDSETVPRNAVHSIIAASSDLIRAENRARSSMRVTFADMKSAVNKAFSFQLSLLDSNDTAIRGQGATSTNGESPAVTIGGISEVSSCMDTTPLSEHIEFRGYIPLAAIYETYFTDVTIPSLLGGPLTPAKDSIATNRRLRNLDDFVTHTLVPPLPPAPTKQVHPSLEKASRLTSPAKNTKSRSGKKDGRGGGDGSRKGRKKSGSGSGKRESKSRRRRNDSDCGKSDLQDAWQSAGRLASEQQQELTDSKKHTHELPDMSVLSAYRHPSTEEEVYGEACRDDETDLSIAASGERSSRRRGLSVDSDDDGEGDMSDLEEGDDYEDSDEMGTSDDNEPDDYDSSCGDNNDETEAIAAAAVSMPMCDDDDDDEIIVYKPAFSAVAQCGDRFDFPVVQGSKHNTFGSAVDRDAVNYLAALHDKNMSLDGWFSDLSATGAGPAESDAHPSLSEFGGLFGNRLAPRHATDTADRYDGYDMASSVYATWSSPQASGMSDNERGKWETSHEDDKGHRMDKSSASPNGQQGSYRWNERSRPSALDNISCGAPPGFPAVPPGFEDSNPIESAARKVSVWRPGGSHDFDEGPSPLLGRLSVKNRSTG